MFKSLHEIGTGLSLKASSTSTSMDPNTGVCLYVCVYVRSCVCDCAFVCMAPMHCMCVHVRFAFTDTKKPSQQAVIIQEIKHMQVCLSIIPNDKLLIGYKDLQYPLGRGGFGTVYKGTWQGISVAIKRLHLTAMTKEALSEFQSEATIMANVNHLNTLRLYGVCLDRGRFSLVTPLMTKGSLFQLLHNKQALPWRLRYQLSRGIACGLSYLHSRTCI